MRKRCLNPNSLDYKNYGGRGITICKEWLESFNKFVEDVGVRPTPQHTLDRIDNNSGYEKNNIQWATRQTQILNRRNTNPQPYVYWWKIRKKWRVIKDNKYYGIFSNYAEAVTVAQHLCIR